MNLWLGVLDCWKWCICLLVMSWSVGVFILMMNVISLILIWVVLLWVIIICIGIKVVNMISVGNKCILLKFVNG